MKRFLKRFLIIAIVVIVAFNIFAFCVNRNYRVLLSIGWYKNKQFWTHGWRDYTDFAIYDCPWARPGISPYFSKITPADTEIIGEYLDNYEKWIEMISRGNTNDELVVNYSFDRAVIDTDDYFYIYVDENDSKFYDYDVWIFDTQSETLYFFHNND